MTTVFHTMDFKYVLVDHRNYFVQSIYPPKTRRIHLYPPLFINEKSFFIVPVSLLRSIVPQLLHNVLVRDGHFGGNDTGTPSSSRLRT